MKIYRIVKCPNCGKYRKTSSTKTVKCFYCGKTFTVMNHVVSNENYKKEINKKEVGFKTFKV
ncbi:MAG: hypothetical protein OH338_02065 [Candidatus Parvarchaeota archaeon]|jgi:hypothetical protein|nr:hypothetical protein [Candidatus Parvarchaeota archaeon]MCW1294455.1 hypothetical protein [Candidatus Parvarchaeum tengchongense]MCW1295536.1 hypothetical protein [Candidatus Parvarchaeum tengchongense]MCW1298786.1 hypothetical protein [Candidatus Parvarchaeum tengchongense]MCW1312197.1 hypothetical protein [Candidatus Parvarchaeum tengchongense]